MKYSVQIEFKKDRVENYAKIITFQLQVIKAKINLMSKSPPIPGIEPGAVVLLSLMKDNDVNHYTISE